MVGKGGEDILFNHKAPSQFRFTPSRLWAVTIWLDDPQKVILQETWRPPALIHRGNRHKRLEVNLPPGTWKLGVDVDAMGEVVRLEKGITVLARSKT